jgi:hypothetical protein
VLIKYCDAVFGVGRRVDKYCDLGKVGELIKYCDAVCGIGRVVDKVL